ncbi:hypothetical protein [Burkholderia sp. LMG 21824]|uniref:hypothetical protein n=1 Tax=Burkholderia sp. LMG 21824 TaxID=3158172 RepID=UPI003C2B709E
MDAYYGHDHWEVLGAAVMCDLHPRLAQRYTDLSPVLRVALACSDNPLFVRLAMESDVVPDWQSVRDLLAKPRLELDDMLALATWGKAHPAALERINMAHATTGILNVSAGGSLGFRMLESGHSSYLIYLFAGESKLCPMLDRFDPYDPQGEALPADDSTSPTRRPWSDGGGAYKFPYLYRAKVVQALLEGDITRASEIVAIMRQRVQHYYHGSPASFINATAKLVVQFAKRAKTVTKTNGKTKPVAAT